MVLSGFHMCGLLWASPEPREGRNSINYEVESEAPSIVWLTHGHLATADGT